MEKETVFVEKKKLTERIKKFWGDHHEAIIVGGLGLSANLLTGYVGYKYVKFANGNRLKTVELWTCQGVPENEYPEGVFNLPFDIYVTRRNGTKECRHVEPINQTFPAVQAATIPMELIDPKPVEIAI